MYRAKMAYSSSGCLSHSQLVHMEQQWGITENVENETKGKSIVKCT